MNVGLERLQLIWLYVEHFFCTSSLVLTNAAIFSLSSQRGGAAAPAPSFWMFCENFDWTDSRTMAASRCGSASVSDRSCRSLRIRSCSVCSARTSAVRTSRECKQPRSSSQYTGFMISCVFMMNLSVIDICMCVCVWWRVEAFNAGFLHMNDLQRQNTVTNFILPFLSSQPAGTEQTLSPVFHSPVLVRLAH